MNPNISSHPHFHIRWHGKALDWECFDSREQAAERATIDEVIEECHSRAKLGSTKSDDCRTVVCRHNRRRHPSRAFLS